MVSNVCGLCLSLTPFSTIFQLHRNGRLYVWRKTSWQNTHIPNREHLSSPPLCSGVPVTLSLILYVCFVDRCLSFCTFSFGHCLVCPSIYGLPFWYLQTLLIVDIRIVRVVKLLITQILLFCLRYFVKVW
jgi:hypothetical protein